MSLNLIDPFLKFGGGALGLYQELGRTTLGSTSTTLDVSSLASKPYHMVLINMVDAGGSINQRNNADSSSVYGKRNSYNGGSDTTGASQSEIIIGENIGASTQHRFGVTFANNISPTKIPDFPIKCFKA